MKMKNNKINLLFGLLMFSCCALMAQDYAFKVLANKGSNQVKSGETLMPIKTELNLKPPMKLRFRKMLT
jgi:hypothetical protein